MAGIGNINSGTPVGSTDSVSEGDDQIRALKQDIKTSFPGFTTGVDVLSSSADDLDTAVAEAGTGATHAGVTGNPHGTVAADISDVYSETEVDNALALKQDTSEKGQINGYCGLNASGEVDPSDIALAEELVAGILRRASQAEVDAGSANYRTVSPNTLANATTVEHPSNKGANNGYCGLGAGGLVDESDLPQATDSAKGAIEIATQAEVDAGTDTSRAVTPDTLANYSGITAERFYANIRKTTSQAYSGSQDAAITNYTDTVSNVGSAMTVNATNGTISLDLAGNYRLYFSVAGRITSTATGASIAEVEFEYAGSPVAGTNRTIGITNGQTSAESRAAVSCECVVGSGGTGALIHVNVDNGTLAWTMDECSFMVEYLG